MQKNKNKKDLMIKAKIKEKALILAIVCLPFVFVGIAHASEMEQEIIEEVNKERQKKGLQIVKENELLSKAAFLKAQDMVGNDYFAHTSPEGVDPWSWLEEVEYEYKYAGENLAMDFSSASSVHRAWMRSASHRDNIMSEKYKEIGVAVLEGIIDGKETMVAVQFFGLPLNEESVLLNNDPVDEQSEIKLQEVSVRPWEGTEGNEIVIYTKISGEPSSVEAYIGDKQFSLEKIQNGKYLNLISLNDVDLDKDNFVIKTKMTEEESLYFEVPKGIYAEYVKIEDEDEEEEEEVLSMVASSNSTSLAIKEKAVSSQNAILAGFMMVCMIMIANVWILEKEEERLLESCHV